MASRMERYYEKPRAPRARSARNEDLYKRIQDMDEYTNIAAVESIARTNEIDISRVQEMIKNRENYKKQRQYRNVFSIEEDKPKEVEVKKYFQDEKNYDIMDVLNKAKDNHEEDNTNRSLKNTHYDVINELNLRNNNYEDSEEELKDLINTITSKKSNDDDVGLLDDLTANTMVGEASSIHKILEEEKKQQRVDNTNEMDKSFFTSAISFSDKDFEDLKNKNKKLKNKKLLLIIIIGIILLTIAGIIIFLIVR